MREGEATGTGVFRFCLYWILLVTCRIRRSGAQRTHAASQKEKCHHSDYMPCRNVNGLVFRRCSVILNCPSPQTGCHCHSFVTTEQQLMREHLHWCLNWKKKMEQNGLKSSGLFVGIDPYLSVCLSIVPRYILASFGRDSSLTKPFLLLYDLQNCRC